MPIRYSDNKIHALTNTHVSKVNILLTLTLKVEMYAVQNNTKIKFKIVL